jgi:hypothetical protein
VAVVAASEAAVAPAVALPACISSVGKRSKEGWGSHTPRRRGTHAFPFFDVHVVFASPSDIFLDMQNAFFRTDPCR